MAGKKKAKTSARGPLFTKRTQWDRVWMSEPEGHDLAAAADYLSLLHGKKPVRETVRRLRDEKTRLRTAKDIMRASHVDLLPADNLHVRKNIEKVMRGKQLSPVLLVRRPEGLIIADGYHRGCAAQHLTEDLTVPCRLA
ncbi:hypothetical protein ACFW2X_16540 [Streptomyces antibioticus]|uniref:hypothetical protein n=1 Tax=Streptomyces antibioticus TaxID=1890 RepID=UPI003696CB54